MRCDLLPYNFENLDIDSQGVLIKRLKEEYDDIPDSLLSLLETELLRLKITHFLETEGEKILKEKKKVKKVK